MKFGPLQIGIIVIILALALTVVLVLFTQSKVETADSTCGMDMSTGSTCPHRGNLPYESYLGGLVVLGLLAIGGYSIWLSKQNMKIDSELKQKVSKLPVEEKQVYDLIVAQDGAAFQSEIVEKSKLDKVKVSRLLDKLEGRGLIERRRRGMTNLVIVKSAE